jgi:glycolate oxidase iron-sulfur subunit
LKPQSDILKMADQCVMCGLCIPHCPTYALSQEEGESPRGRISLITAVARHQLEADETVRRHLDNCLMCRACETVCPSDVEYGRLMDQARAALGPDTDTVTESSATENWFLDTVLPDRKRTRRLQRLLRLLQTSGIAAIVKRSGLARRLGIANAMSLLPTVPRVPQWQRYYPPVCEKKKDVALFTGCLGELVQAAEIQATITLFNWLGYGVHVPSSQTCCGALFVHDGKPEQANALYRQNADTFSALDVDAIVTLASGCNVALREWQPASGAGNAGSAWRAQVIDAHSFLARENGLAGHTLSPTTQRVAIHTPCTLRNRRKQPDSVTPLLRQIPGIELIELSASRYCCGAAGSHMLKHAQHARQLREPLINELRDVKPDILVTSNVGCALHLQQGLRDNGENVEVIHPLSLLNRHLPQARAPG